MRSRLAARRRWRLLALLVALSVGAVLLVRGPAGPPDPDGPDWPAHNGRSTSAGALHPQPAHLGTGRPTPEPDVTGRPVADRPRPSRPVPHDAGGVTGAARLDPALAAAATEAAARFVVQWSTPGSDWHQRLSALATSALAAALADADPPQPPPRLAPAPAVILLSTPQWARVAVATDRGEVVLDLVRLDHGWLVAGVDWRPG